MNGWTIDQLQSLRQVAVGGAFAFAGKFALRLSEDLQKFVPFRRVNQFNGFRTTGHACEFLRLTSDRTDGIQQLLGRQHASSRVTEVDFVVSVIFVSLRAELIDAAVHDRPNQMTLREPTLQKLVGQIAQQLRIGWRIGIAEVIHRIHNTFAHDMPPNAIREGLRKEWIAVIGQPVGKHNSTILISRHIDVAFKQEANFHLFTGSWLSDLAASLHENHLIVRQAGFLSAHSSECCGRTVVIILSPFFERMIVTLCALDADTHKQLSGRFCCVNFITAGFPISRRRVLLSRAGCREKIASELIERHVIFYCVVQPAAEFVHTGFCHLLAVAAKQIRPLHRPEPSVIITRKQPINHRSPLCLRLFGDKQPSFLQGRQTARQIKRCAAEEIGITAQFRWLDLKLLQFAKHKLVDCRRFRRTGPLELGAICKKRNLSRRHFIQIPSQHGNFTASLL